MRTRAAIVRAAAEAFAEQGFAGTSVASITKRAGVTLGALYFHFASKEELAREIVRAQPDQVRAEGETTGLQRAVDVTMAWAHQLRDDPMLLAGARLVLEQESFVDGVAEEHSHQQWTQIMEHELCAAQDRGEMREGTDAQAVARLVVNACTGAQMHSQLASGRRDLPQRVAEMWRCLLPAVATEEAASGLDLSEVRGRTT
ncbi:helix-turn-helix transcriptional regulator [Streptomyces sp. HNM0574]|nr:helix-turn-helix transcriptional regulator [Streptomyces sp. HNM0574]